MDRDEITVLINIFDIENMGDLAAQVPCGIYRNIRIISVYIHAQADGRVGYDNTDRAEAYDSELFTLQLSPREFLLLLLRGLGDILIAAVVANPVDAAHDISCCEKHAGKDELFYAVCVGAGRIEYNDALLSAFLQRNVVDTCAGSCDRIERIGKFHVVQRGTSDQKSVCFRGIADLLVFVGEILKSDRGNAVQACKFISHFISPCVPLQIFS